MTPNDGPLTEHEIRLVEAWIRRNHTTPPWMPHNTNRDYDDRMWDLHRRALNHHQHLQPFAHTPLTPNPPLQHPYQPDTGHHPHTIPATYNPIRTPTITITLALAITGILALTLYLLGGC